MQRDEDVSARIEKLSKINSSLVKERKEYEKYHDYLDTSINSLFKSNTKLLNSFKERYTTSIVLVKRHNSIDISLNDQIRTVANLEKIKKIIDRVLNSKKDDSKQIMSPKEAIEAVSHIVKHEVKDLYSRLQLLRQQNLYEEKYIDEIKELQKKKKRLEEKNDLIEKEITFYKNQFYDISLYNGCDVLNYPLIKLKEKISMCQSLRQDKLDIINFHKQMQRTQSIHKKIKELNPSSILMAFGISLDSEVSTDNISSLCQTTDDNSKNHKNNKSEVKQTQVGHLSSSTEVKLPSYYKYYNESNSSISSTAKSSRSNKMTISDNNSKYSYTSNTKSHTDKSDIINEKRMRIIKEISTTGQISHGNKEKNNKSSLNNAKKSDLINSKSSSAYADDDDYYNENFYSTTSYNRKSSGRNSDTIKKDSKISSSSTQNDKSERNKLDKTKQSKANDDTKVHKNKSESGSSKSRSESVKSKSENQKSNKNESESSKSSKSRSESVKGKSENQKNSKNESESSKSRSENFKSKSGTQKSVKSENESKRKSEVREAESEVKIFKSEARDKESESSDKIIFFNHRNRRNRRNANAVMYSDIPDAKSSNVIPNRSTRLKISPVRSYGSLSTLCGPQEPARQRRFKHPHARIPVISPEKCDLFARLLNKHYRDSYSNNNSANANSILIRDSNESNDFYSFLNNNNNELGIKEFDTFTQTDESFRTMIASILNKQLERFLNEDKINDALFSKHCQLDELEIAVSSLNREIATRKRNRDKWMKSFTIVPPEKLSKIELNINREIEKYETSSQTEEITSLSKIRDEIIKNSKINPKSFLKKMEQRDLVAMLTKKKLELKIFKMANVRKQLDIDSLLKRLKIVDPLMYSFETHEPAPVEVDRNIMDKKQQKIDKLQSLDRHYKDVVIEGEMLVDQIADQQYLVDSITNYLTEMAKEPKSNVQSLCRSLKNDRGSINETSRQVRFVTIENEAISKEICRYDEMVSQRNLNLMTQKVDNLYKYLFTLKSRFNNLRAVKEKRSYVMTCEGEMNSLQRQINIVLSEIDVYRMRINGTISKIEKQIRTIEALNIRNPKPISNLNWNQKSKSKSLHKI